MNSLRTKHREKLSQEEVVSLCYLERILSIKLLQIKALVDELEKLDDEHWALKRTSAANTANTAKLEALEEEMMTLKDSRGVDKVLTESLRAEVHFLEEENLIQVGCISSLRKWLEEEKKKSQQSKAKADAVGVSHKKDIDRLKGEKRKAEEELESTKGKLKRIKDALEGNDLKSEGKM
jgi:ERCC4-related helicase